jgi:hypothetical protein
MDVRNGNLDQSRLFPSPEERSRRVRQLSIGKRLGRALGGVETQSVPEEFLDLLRQADARRNSR